MRKRWKRRLEALDWAGFDEDDQWNHRNRPAEQKVLKAFRTVLFCKTICRNLPLHEHCLLEICSPVRGHWYFTELAAGLYEIRLPRFLLSALPLRMPSALDSTSTPVTNV